MLDGDQLWSAEFSANKIAMFDLMTEKITEWDVNALLMAISAACGTTTCSSGVPLPYYGTYPAAPALTPCQAAV
jgi:hypothetical protein